MHELVRVCMCVHVYMREKEALRQRVVRRNGQVEVCVCMCA